MKNTINYGKLNAKGGFAKPIESDQIYARVETGFFNIIAMQTESENEVDGIETEHIKILVAVPEGDDAPHLDDFTEWVYNNEMALALKWATAFGNKFVVDYRQSGYFSFHRTDGSDVNGKDFKAIVKLANEAANQFKNEAIKGILTDIEYLNGDLDQVKNDIKQKKALLKLYKTDLKP